MRWREDVEAALRPLAPAVATLLASEPPVGAAAAPGAAAGGDAAAAEAEAAALDALDALRAALDRGAAQLEWLTWLAAPGRDGCTPMRDVILRGVFVCMDCAAHPHVVLRACACVLRVARGATVRTAVQLLFRLSKEDRNDPQFRREGLLLPLLALLGVTDAGGAAGTKGPRIEVQVYAAGTLKNVTHDGANQRAAARAGAVEVLSTLLHARCTAGGRDGALTRPQTPRGSAAGGDATAQLAVQLTGCLRNLAVLPSHIPLFVRAMVPRTLAAVLVSFAAHRELALNCAS